MQINNYDNKTHFSAIKLKNTTFNDARDAAMFLQMNCFKPLGYKQHYISRDNIQRIKSYIKYHRENHLYGIPNEFGTIIFPWSKEAYIISSPKNEQEIITLLKDFTPNASLNMLL